MEDERFPVRCAGTERERVAEFLDGLAAVLEHEAITLDDERAFVVVTLLHADVLEHRTRLA